ncbi:MAG TPA: hypothetical protein VLK82_03500, partial [Candidatus Tectomicrobia bacterium]|nr:hypothetical protein [Candidatus Tectomicrobia bacterium]
QVLKQPFPELEGIERAKRPRRLPTVFTAEETQAGYRCKAGQFDVGRVLYGAKFNYEFSPLAEDRPTWDIGPKAA